MLSIHQEGTKYVVRDMARSTEQIDSGKGADGKKISSHSTRAQASTAIRNLAMAQKKEIAVAAAKELLAVTES